MAKSDKARKAHALVRAGVDPVEACRQAGYTNRPGQAAKRLGLAQAAKRPTPEPEPAQELSLVELAHSRVRTTLAVGADPQALAAARLVFDNKLAADAAGVPTVGDGVPTLVMVFPSNSRGPAPRHVIEVADEQQVHDLFARAAGIRERVFARVEPIPTVVVDRPAPELAPAPEPTTELKPTTPRVRSYKPTISIPGNNS